jgi:hypothetical protein
MKLSTLMLAGLMAVSSAAAFAEGGAERSMQHWEKFKLSQQQTHGKSDNTASINSAKTPPAADNQTVNKQESGV